MAHRRRGRRAAASITLLAAVALAGRWIWTNQTPVMPHVTPYPYSAEHMVGPNAAHFYAAAADTWNKHYGGVQPELRLAPLTDRRRVLALNKEALHWIRVGEAYRYQGEVTRACRTDSTIPFYPQPPNYIVVRELARILAADASVKGIQGDKVGALSASLDAVRYGHDFAQSDRDLLGGMVGMLAAGIGTAEAQDHVAGLDSRTARAAIRRLETIRSEKIALPQMIQSWQRARLARCTEEFTHPELLLGPGILLSRLQVRLEMDALLLRYGKQGLIDRYMASSNEAIRIAALPYQTGKGLWNRLEPTNAYEQITNPNLTRAAQQITSLEAREGILLARLAVQAYRAEHAGAAPTTLDELTRGAHPYLSASPDDPFSSDGQALLRYRNGGVYSVGENCRDEYGGGDDGDVWWRSSPAARSPQPPPSPARTHDASPTL